MVSIGRGLQVINETKVSGQVGTTAQFCVTRDISVCAKTLIRCKRKLQNRELIKRRDLVTESQLFDLTVPYGCLLYTSPSPRD